MQNVMTKAWEIAYKGQSKFGGKVSEYFAKSLKLAWSIVKKALDTVNEYAKQIKGTIAKYHMPGLKGSEKQVKWAMDIRKDAWNALIGEVMYEEYEVKNKLPGRKTKVEKRPINSLINAMLSVEKIESHFNEMEQQGLPKSRLESTVESMNNALDRYARFVEIMTNDSAKFWIDNRNNQEQNYMFKRFKKYVTHGEF